MSLGRAAVTVGACTGLSRVLGFVRDLLIAAALGAGPVADAFFISLKLANFLRRLFAEGAFSAAFVPLFTRLTERRGSLAARRFAGEALAVLALVLVVVVATGELLMPWLVRLLAAGFDPASVRFVLAVELTRLAFPYILFISLAALLSGILQASHRFAAAAAAPLLLNLVLIAALLLADRPDADTARLLAWCVTLAGIAQLAWLAAAVMRAELAPRPAPPRLSPEVRRLLSLIAPGIVGLGVVQINMLVSSWFATHLPPGTVAYLFYADRLVQLPLGIVGVALGTVLLPALSRLVDNVRAGQELQNRAIETALLLGLPAAVGLAALAEPIIRVLFERGAFSPEATRATAETLAGLALGLPAYLLVKVLAPVFYAMEDMRTPVRIAALALLVNAAAALLLATPLAHLGIALALSLSIWTNALGLGWVLWRRRLLVPDPALCRHSAGIAASVTVMTAALLAARHGVALPGGAGGLFLLIGLGLASFAAAGVAFGPLRPQALRRLWRIARA